MQQQRFIAGAQKFILVFIIPFAFFYGISVPYRLYSILSICLCAYLFVSFRRKSRGIFSIALLFLIANGIAYVGAKWLRNGNLYIDTVNIVLTVIYAIFLVYLLCALFTKRNKNPLKDLKLYPQRKEDIARIKEYLEVFNVIGITGVWGSGKTVVVEHLKTDCDMSKKYEFITIDLLSCNLDEVQIAILDELQKILSKYRIFSKHTNQLKQILGSVSFFDKLQGFFSADNTLYKDALNGLKNDLELIDKTIVIVYEDIDRINQKGIIKKIFSISEQLSSDKIKAIYQYDWRNLQQLGFNRQFTEKYIPYVVNLTDIDLFETIKFYLDDLKIDKSILCMDDFKHIYLPVHLNYHFQKKFNKYSTFELYSFELGLRKPKQFLYELNNFLQSNELFQGKDKKRITITYFFIKHFFDNIYEKIVVGRSLMDTLLFEYENQNYTIMQLMENSEITAEIFSEILKNQNNSAILSVLDWLEYNFDVNTIAPCYIDDENNLKRANKNESIDSTIWKLWANGKSGYTDSENAANLLCQNVLNKPSEEQTEAFNDFRKNMFNEKEDNRTIFRLGVNSFISIFQAFCIADVTADDWKRLIDFYFRYEEVSEVNANLISVLTYCDIANEAVYICVLEHFNRLRIVGNLNKFKPYSEFIVKYLRGLSSKGYIDIYDIGLLINNDGIVNVFERAEVADEDVITVPEVVDFVFNKMRKKLEELNDRIPISEVKCNLQTTINFIDKNQELITTKNAVRLGGPPTKIEMRSRFVNQEEYDRLKGLTLSAERFAEEVKNSYLNENISIHEIDRLYQGIEFK